MNVLLPIMLLLPLLGALACALVPGERMVRAAAVLASAICAAMCIPLIAGLPASGDVAYNVNLGGIDAIGFSFSLGVDPISAWLVALTAFLQPLAIIASFSGIQHRQREYYAWMLLLLTAMLGVFMARDALLFYMFFEATLVPMFFIIGIWGGPQRRHAASRFFLFTFCGSIFALAAVIYLGARYHTLDIASLIRLATAGDAAGVLAPLSRRELWWVVLGLLAGFAVKVPLLPVHTWLPLAHTEAPTAGSVILAGVLLKLGTYGIMRFVVPLGFAGADGVVFAGLIRFVGALSVAGIIYGALAAWAQRDIKKLVAYSSVSHLGFCVLGLASLSAEGMQGAVLYMVNHGLSTGAMFLVVGMIYERLHTRDIEEISGLASRMPVLSFFFVLFVLSSIGLPGLNGFVSEFLTILGAVKSPVLGVAYGALAACGIVLSAVYMLHMTGRVIFGPARAPAAGTGAHQHADAASGSNLRDIGPAEAGVLVPIAVAVVLLGVMPAGLLRTLDAPVKQLIQTIDRPAAVVSSPPVEAPPALPASPCLKDGASAGHEPSANAGCGELPIHA